MVLKETLAVCSLPPGTPVPDGILAGSLSAIIQTNEEITLICRSDHIPPGAKFADGWRAIKVRGPLAFELTGVLASLAQPLAQNGVSTIAVSTYETDLILVREESLTSAVDVLLDAGYTFDRE